MARWPFRLFIIALLGLLVALPPATDARVTLSVEQSVQSFLDAQPGPLKTYRDGDHSAAEWIQGASAYYGLSPRILLALLEATNSLLSNPAPGDDALRQPFSPVGPHGFGVQIDWAAQELRAGLGPYDRPPIVQFTDGTTLTLTLAQAPEGVAVQRFLAKNRSETEWRAAVDRFGRAFQIYFNNELPYQQPRQPTATTGFLQRPWPIGTRVMHLAYFDHMFPTVDTGRPDNGFVVNYLGKGNVQYDGHDGNDFFFPDKPIGTFILAAADGTAYARTHRGNGVVIVHPGGYETVYWHLDKFANIFKGKVDTDYGVAVHAGDLIGSSGRTGFVIGSPHLHFEVRHNGREVDPYGWYGPGADPCTAYVACEASKWLWHASLSGEFDFTPPNTAPPDRVPPIATMSVNPPDDLLFLAHFDGNPLQQVGMGTPTILGKPVYSEAKFNQGVHIGQDDRLTYPINGNLRLDAGTIAFWARLPEKYPLTKTASNYLLAASANPDAGPIYTGTLALGRDQLGPDHSPRWNFWTTPNSGDAGRNDLAVPDTLTPGLHHFAISWDRATHSKALYLDGALAIATVGVSLPENIGDTLDLGQFAPSHGQSDVTIDELAIFGRALDPSEIQQLAQAQTPLNSSEARVVAPDLRLDVNAMDDAGGIMSVQIGIDGVFGDPQSYHDEYHLVLPVTSGNPQDRSYTIAARFFDRAGNSTTVSTTVTLVQVPFPKVTLEDETEAGITLVFSPTNTTNIEVQASTTPTFSNTPWQPLPASLPWQWTSGTPHATWLRFRDAKGLISAASVVGPDARQVYLPLIRSSN